MATAKESSENGAPSIDSTNQENTGIPKRQFGKSDENISYVKGKKFLNLHENREVQFKALSQEERERLPWKIMKKARIFICGVLNGGEEGTIYFGIGDSMEGNAEFKHGEIIGLEIEDLKDDIRKAFESMLNDHITSDDGKMRQNGDMKCVVLYFVKVASTNRYVIEIDVKREWEFCKNYVYFVEVWKKKEPLSNRYGLNDMYNVTEKDVAYIRTCGKSKSIKGSKIQKDIREPLSQKYKQWKETSSSISPVCQESQEQGMTTSSATSAINSTSSSTSQLETRSGNQLMVSMHGQEQGSLADGRPAPRSIGINKPSKGIRKVHQLGETTYIKILDAFSRDVRRLNALPGIMNYSHDVVDGLRRSVNTETYVDRLITHWSEEHPTHDIPKFIRILGELKMGELEDILTREYKHQTER